MNERRKRASHAELRHLVGVFDNGRAPRGWVEIQRFDSLDTGPPDLRPLKSDDEAAMLVAETAQMPGTAMALHLESGAFFALERSASGVGPDPDEIRHLKRARDPKSLPVPLWISVVPARAAREAGLLTIKAEARAYSTRARHLDEEGSW